MNTRDLFTLPGGLAALAVAVGGCNRPLAPEPDTGLESAADASGLDAHVPPGTDAAVETRADAGTGTCSDPALFVAPGSDGWDTVRDAAGTGQRFERVSIPGITDRAASGEVSLEETGGLALSDVDGDGRTDVLVLEQNVPVPRAFRYFHNDGCWRFTPSSLGIPTTTAAFNAQALFVDFDADAVDEILLVRRRNGTSAYRQSGGEYVDVAASVGIDTRNVYTSQPHVADLNLDGFLDLVIVSDSIGADGSRPRHFVYVFDPPSMRFVDVAADDSILPDFSPTATEPCDPETFRSGPAIVVRDLDDDGDVDLAHPYHRDVIDPGGDLLFDDCSPASFAHGVAVWENHMADEGRFRFTHREPGPGGAFDDTDLELAERTRIAAEAIPMRYVGHATSLPYMAAADVDNDGDLDLAVTGPTDPQWHAQSDRIAGKAWRNDGGFRFAAATEAAGLDAMNWTYREWRTFWDAPDMPSTSAFVERLCTCSYDVPSCTGFALEEHQFYGGDIVYADFDNDGWLDMLLVDRHEMEDGERYLRNVLFHNDGDGTFTPEPTTISGIDSNSITAEVADLDGDGLLDLVFGTSPGNSSGRSNPCLTRMPGNGALDVAEVQYLDRVYWNTGRVGGAADNHWLRVRLTGLPDSRLVGAQIFAQSPGTSDCTGAGEARSCVGRRDYFPVTSYKSTHELEVHFGLGARTEVDLRLVLPRTSYTAAARTTFTDVPVDELVELDVTTGAVRILPR